MQKVEFHFAEKSESMAVQAILSACNLPSTGLDQLESCIVASIHSKIVGVVALDLCGQSALLRSLAVLPDYRVRSLGRSLCEKAINHARLLGVTQLYLLTTEAADYFARLGFKRIAREEVPLPIQQTSQFRSICPKSAICMTRDIANEVIHASSDLLRVRPDVPGARMWAVALEKTMLTYFEVDPNCRFETHSHESEQITMVLSGELFFEMQGIIHCIKQGEVIAIPSSVPHAVWTDCLAVTAVDAWSPVMKKYEAAIPS